MSKILEATCLAGVVTAKGVVIPGVEILSDGIGASSGILLIDEDKAYYIPESTPDLDDILEQIIDALEQAKTCFDQAVTALDQTASVFTETFLGMTGPTTAPPPTGATDVAAIVTASAAITTAATSLEAAKIELQTIKERLR